MAQIGDSRLDFGDGVAGGDVLRAVPVEGVDRHQHGALHDCVVGRVGQGVDQVLLVPGGNHPRMPEDLQPAPVAVIHDDHRDPVVGGQIAGADVLVPVSYTHLRAHETDSYLVCRL